MHHSTSMPGPSSQRGAVGLSEWRFADRRDAGRQLATELGAYVRRPNVIVLALPRGGVPVGYEVARALQAPLDVFIVRKLGFPGQAELAMGAIASGGKCVLNEGLVRRAGVPEEVIARVAERELHEIARREHDYRRSDALRDTRRGGPDGSSRPALDPRGKDVILVDDGLATGATMRAAVLALRQQGPARIVVAVPVAAPESCAEMRAIADEVVCPLTPRRLRAIGLWYEDFDQTTDEEVRSLLAAAGSS